MDDPREVEYLKNYKPSIDDLKMKSPALISENYVEKKDAGYPLEFVEWLIKDQEIFFGELNEEYILNDNIHVDGRKLQTIDELFNYWANNEK
jgi:hypothetical protein